MEILIDGFSKLTNSTRIGFGESGTRIQWSHNFKTYAYWFDDSDLLHVHTQDEFWVYWVKKDALGKALYDIENRPLDDEIDF